MPSVPTQVIDPAVDHENQILMRPLKITVAVNSHSMFNAKVENDNGPLNVTLLEEQDFWEQIRTAPVDDIDPLRSMAEW